MHWIRDVALFLALGWLLLVALTTARAQEPTPEPTPDFFTSICEAADIEGGVTRVLPTVEIRLPPGTYGITLGPLSTGDPAFFLCHKESGGILNMNAVNCEENSRVTPNAEAESVISAIASSCKALPPPTPTPCSGDIEGDHALTVGSITFTLPPGSYGVHTFPTADVIYSVTVCTTVDASTVRLSAYDCDKTYREQYTSAAAIVLDQIVSSCRLTGPAPYAGITPPATGSGGLVKT